jgi:hypothetical protein
LEKGYEMSWKKILNELSFRVSDGVPDLTNEQHLMKLFDVLKEHEWPVEARVELLKNLTEVDIVKKKQKDGSYGGAYTVQKHNPERGQKLITKNASQDQIKQVQKKKKDDGDDDSTQGSEESQVSMSNTIDRGGDSEIKNLALKYGFKEVEGVFKPAPGNAGSLLNEIISGEVAQMVEENPNLSEEELVGILYERFGDSELFKSKKKNGNSGSKKPVGGISIKDVPEEHKKEAGLYSKVVLAVRSGKRKHKKATESAKKNGFKNSKIENYYGHSSSFDAMVNDIKDKQVIGPDGTEISQEEAEQLIRSGGGGDNPSDTATLVFDKDSNKVIMLFHSDKDSTEALIAQSSIKAEAEANEENIDKMVEDGSLTKEQGEKVKKDQKELIRKNDEIESKLKKVVNEPGKWFLKNTNTKDVLDNIKNDTGPDGSEDKNKTSTKFGNQPPKNETGAVLDSKGKPRPYLNKYLEEKGIDPNEATEEQSLEAFLEFMGDDNKVNENGEEIIPSDDAVTLMERINTRYIEQGAPDIFTKLEDIRNESLQLQRDFITEQDKIKVKIDGKEVGMGTLLEGNTVWKQFHLEASNPNSEVGVHKYPGMFETNHGGLSVDGEVLRECMGGDVENKNDFIVRFEVGPLEEQKGVSGTQKGKTTGGKRIVYAITSDNKKIEVGQKVMRTKTGKTGKLQTVYNWSKDMKDCFEKEGKR